MQFIQSLFYLERDQYIQKKIVWLLQVEISRIANPNDTTNKYMNALLCSPIKKSSYFKSTSQVTQRIIQFIIVIIKVEDVMKRIIFIITQFFFFDNFIYLTGILSYETADNEVKRQNHIQNNKLKHQIYLLDPFILLMFLSFENHLQKIIFFLFYLRKRGEFLRSVLLWFFQIKFRRILLKKQALRFKSIFIVNYYFIIYLISFYLIQNEFKFIFFMGQVNAIRLRRSLRFVIFIIQSKEFYCQLDLNDKFS
ncbi:hypothetical protein ABPG72_020279 [Tetrahymena utriculariae]